MSNICAILLAFPHAEMRNTHGRGMKKNGYRTYALIPSHSYVVVVVHERFCFSNNEHRV